MAFWWAGRWAGHYGGHDICFLAFFAFCALSNLLTYHFEVRTSGKEKGKHSPVADPHQKKFGARDDPCESVIAIITTPFYFGT